ncbi:unnamed protein product [Orchesella dallaii]|uniref:Sulfatase N-terminal domain-containing protein n=1 Tax=Orchesella dallaii TaxID=48710 RepID=A0ABP1QSU2_9HEXA
MRFQLLMMGLPLQLGFVILICLWSVELTAGQTESIQSKDDETRDLEEFKTSHNSSVIVEDSDKNDFSSSVKESPLVTTEDTKDKIVENNEADDHTNPPFPSQSSSFWEPELDEVGREYDETEQEQIANAKDHDAARREEVEETEGRDTTTNNQSKEKDERPNIILIITDDQDVELGSMEYMPETLKVFRTGGVEFRHGYVSTPICCPSRSSLLTGMYVHNHEVFTNNDNCSSISWREKYEKKTFAAHLWSSGYYTNYIGKYLNKYDGSHIPHGWDEWNGLLMNSRYYNYTLNRNGKRFRYGNDLERDYYPDLIARDGLDFLDRVAADPSKQPFLLVLSFPSPHGPEDSAQKYSNLFLNATPHHTPSYNFAPNSDKQWILRVTDKMTPMLKEFTNVLMTKRLQTLQSVDVAVGQIFRNLEAKSLRDSTYAFYTSDHGYHVGQFGLVKGKSMPYEFDIRVPFFMAGPKSMVRGGTIIREPVLNIDFAPTFLELANLIIPDEIDGRSMVPLIRKYCPTCEKNDAFEWPDVFLIESPGRRNPPPHSGVGGASGEHFDRHPKKAHKKKNREKIVLDEDEVLSLTNLCAMHPHPCMPGQKKFCRREKNRVRFRKCRQNIDFLVSTRLFAPDPRFNDPVYGSSHNSSTSDVSGQKCSCRFRRSASLEYSEDDVTIDWETERRRIDDEIEKLKQRIEYLRTRRKHMRRKWLAENHPGVSEDTGYSHREERKNKRRGKVDDTDRRIQIPTEDLDDHDEVREEDYDEDSHESEETEKEENGTVEENDNYDDIRKLDENGTVFDGHAANVEDKETIPVQPNESNNSDHLVSSTVIAPATRSNFPEEPLIDEDNGKDLLESTAVGPTRKPNNHRGKNKHLRNKLKGTYMYNKIPRPTVEGDGSCNCYNDPKWLRQKEREDRKHRKLLSKLRKKQRLFKRIEDPVERQQAETCGKEEKMNCFWHDSDHWRTAPFWTSGSFCFCMNANNNSYSCLRSVNSTHNYLYCQFITGFKMYFDLLQDPYQLRNAIATLPAASEDWILSRLYKLKQCKGRQDCWANDSGSEDVTHPTLWEQIFGSWPKKRRKGGRRSRNKHQGS